MSLSKEAVSTILGRYGIDGERPLVCQISPMDESCDPLGAIDVYYMARQQVPRLQLALVATTVPEDPKDRACFEETARKSMEYSDVFFLSSLNDVGNVEINVFQRAAALTIQRDLQRGFGLWLADALWKERPVVAARRGALPEQVIPGRTGFLAEDDPQFAERMVQLLQDTTLAAKMGEAGRQHVAENFLITRYLADTLRLLSRLVGAGA
jgi:glycosyltransferase involved in cell wall biosynthesis